MIKKAIIKALKNIKKVHYLNYINYSFGDKTPYTKNLVSKYYRKLKIYSK